MRSLVTSRSLVSTMGKGILLVLGGFIVGVFVGVGIGGSLERSKIVTTDPLVEVRNPARTQDEADVLIHKCAAERDSFDGQLSDSLLGVERPIMQYRNLYSCALLIHATPKIKQQIQACIADEILADRKAGIQDYPAWVSRRREICTDRAYRAANQ